MLTSYNLTLTPAGKWAARIAAGDGTTQHLGVYAEKNAAEYAIVEATVERETLKYNELLTRLERDKQRWRDEIYQRNETHRLQMAAIKDKYWQKLSAQGMRENEKELARVMDRMDKEAKTAKDKLDKLKKDAEKYQQAYTLPKPYTYYKAPARNTSSLEGKTTALKAKEAALKFATDRLYKSKAQLLKEQQQVKALKMKENVIKRKAAKELQAVIDELL